MFWLSQSPDLNPIKMLWKDLSKQFLGGNPPTSQFKWFCTKECAKTPTCYCARLISIYKLYLQLLQQKGVTPRFTYFCNAQICNTGSFFLIKKLKKIFFSHLFDSVVCLFSRLIWKSDDDFVHIYAEIFQKYIVWVKIIVFFFYAKNH